MVSRHTLREEIIRLGPWHLDVQVTDELSTRVALDAPEESFDKKLAPNPVSFLSPRDGWVQLMKRVYPNGFEGRSFMEAACNCGGYCFWAKEIGASECFGFDVRDHWIDQARWLAEHRQWPSDGIRFEKLDVYDLPNSDLPTFDIVMFQGIFYHLPDPITALKGAADLCGELLLLDTAIRTDLPDGMLAIAEEAREPVMSGVYGLNWFPTGPVVLKTVLRWMGFPESRVIYWRKKKNRLNKEGLGRMRILASRKEGLLEDFSEVTEPTHTDDRSTFKHATRNRAAD